MKPSIALLLALAALAPAGEGHDHGPQPAAVPAGPVRIGPEARRNLALETARAERRDLAPEAELRGSVQPATGARGILAAAVAARVVEHRARPGDRLEAGAPVLVVQPLVAGAGRVALAAPLAGTLLGRLPEPGAVLAAGQVVAEVADLGRLAVRGRASAQPIPALAAGQPASVRLGDRVLRGVVRHAAPAADSPLPAVDFELTLEGASPADLGAAARVGVRVGAPSPAIAVPLAAVVGEPGREAVFVESEPGLFERRAVALGRREAGWVEVVRGVLPGEAVATRGAYQLQFAGQPSAPADGHGHSH